MTIERGALVWRSSDERHTVILEYPAFEKMRQLAAQHFPNEVGTALVGCYSDDGFIATIKDLAPLAEDSHSSRRFFVRGVQALAQYFTRVFKQSNGLIHYVGDWHSHPNSEATPSATDDANQSAVSADLTTECAESILIILGGHAGEPEEIRAYVYSRLHGRVDLARSNIAAAHLPPRPSDGVQ